MRLLLVAALLVATAAVAGEEEPLPEHHPRPFTAEQIRDQFVVGLHLRFDVTAGGTTETQDWRVVGADQEKVTIAYKLPDEEPSEASYGWVELRDHATFARSTTTVEEVEVEALGATRKARRFTRVTTDDEGRTVREVFDFALDLPGPPVDVRAWTAGVESFRMQQVLRERAP
ncbi:MAG: hypothetical protein GY898_07765 [Proteobacteria bacterium]|nr:hypothetical protein [Pseudomonadota bacterium]